MPFLSDQLPLRTHCGIVAAGNILASNRAGRAEEPNWSSSRTSRLKLAIKWRAGSGFAVLSYADGVATMGLCWVGGAVSERGGRRIVDGIDPGPCQIRWSASSLQAASSCGVSWD